MQDSISINEEGAHIPKELFGQNARIWRALEDAGVLAPAQSQLPATARRAKPIDLTRETAWLQAHRHEFMGEWVALDGDRLLSHGPDAQAVYEAARAAGVRAPLVEFIGPDDEKPFGGW